MSGERAEGLADCAVIGVGYWCSACMCVCALVCTCVCCVLHCDVACLCFVCVPQSLLLMDCVWLKNSA